jgi:hypothetical protein
MRPDEDRARSPRAWPTPDANSGGIRLKEVGVRLSEIAAKLGVCRAHRSSQGSLNSWYEQHGWVWHIARGRQRAVWLRCRCHAIQERQCKMRSVERQMLGQLQTSSGTIRWGGVSGAPEAAH